MSGLKWRLPTHWKLTHLPSPALFLQKEIVGLLLMLNAGQTVWFIQNGRIKKYDDILASKAEHCF